METPIKLKAASLVTPRIESAVADNNTESVHYNCVVDGMEPSKEAAATSCSNRSKQQ